MPSVPKKENWPKLDMMCTLENVRVSSGKMNELDSEETKYGNHCAEFRFIGLTLFFTRTNWNQVQNGGSGNEVRGKMVAHGLRSYECNLFLQVRILVLVKTKAYGSEVSGKTTCHNKCRMQRNCLNERQIGRKRQGQANSTPTD